MKEINESELRKNIEDRLSKYFHLHREQKGYLPNTKIRKHIDLIIQHKKDREITFGIEFKNNKTKKGTDLGDVCLQMQNYAGIKWDFHTNSIKCGRIPIISCPPITINYLNFSSGYDHNPNHDHNNVNSFLFKGFGIGELRKEEHILPSGKTQILKIAMGNKILWREMDIGYDFFDGVTNNEIIEMINSRKGDIFYRERYAEIIRLIDNRNGEKKTGS